MQYDWDAELISARAKLEEFRRQVQFAHRPEALNWPAASGLLDVAIENLATYIADTEEMVARRSSAALSTSARLSTL